MFFNLPTLILPLILLGGITTATPLETRDLKVVEAPGVDVSKLKLPTLATVSVTTRSEVGEGESDVEKRALVPAGATTTSPNSAFHALGATAVDQYVICTTTNCDGSCYGFPLSSLSPEVCYGTPFYYTSFYIYQESNQGLPYGFYAALANCYNPAKLPSVNTCYYSVDSGNNIRYNLETYFRSF